MLNTVPASGESDGEALPPMLHQYREFQRQFPGHLVLFQVGDFYEAFFNDARALAATLNLTLTSRDKQKPDPIPMCGVPVHAIDTYLSRLVDAGLSAVVVRQQESGTTEKRQIDRVVDRVVTPAIRLLTGVHSERVPAPLAAVLVETSGAAIVVADLNAAVVTVHDDIALADIPGVIAALAPAEVVLPRSDDVSRRVSWVREVAGIIGDREGERLRQRGEPAAVSESARRAQAIPGFESISTRARRAVRLLVGYLDDSTLGVGGISFRRIATRGEGNVVVIDAATRRNLELLRNARDGREEGSLFSVMDRTVTVAGARALAQALVAPLGERSRSEARHDGIAALLARPDVRGPLQEALSRAGDVGRIAGRIELRGVVPREVGALRDTLMLRDTLVETIQNLGDIPPLLTELAARISSPTSVDDLVIRAMAEDPPLSLNDGGIIRTGFDSEIDRLRHLAHEGSTLLEALEQRERARTGIASLRIRFSGVFGYVFEVTRTHLTKVPPDFIRRQSTSSVERFVTPELVALSRDIEGSRSKLVDRERAVFLEVRESLLPGVQELRALGESLAELDLLLSFAEVAERYHFTRPELTDGRELVIDQGRAPTLVAALGEGVCPNSVALDGSTQWGVILTGPNMGGKSTFLRLLGHLTILAHAGSFVPATRFVCGLVDRICARLGAHDNPLEGESTFMVEMREAAMMLRDATARSLLLIDELGRGTATHEGCALARAILDELIGVRRARTVCATHYFELTAMEGEVPGAVNRSVKVVTSDDGVVFTHEVIPGRAAYSYAAEVALRAGVTESVVQRGREILQQQRVSAPQQLLLMPMLNAPADRHRKEENRVLQEVRDLDLDAMSPRDIYQRVIGWQERLR